jgi:hypothetical protein
VLLHISGNPTYQDLARAVEKRQSAQAALGAILSHSVFALCFAAFLLGRSDAVWSVPALRGKHPRA